MKRILPLTDAILLEREGSGKLSAGELATATKRSGGLPARLPAQVADILLAHQRIDDPRKLDKAKECRWIAEQDWLYRIAFANPAGEGAKYLSFGGLDTLCDVYLNDQLVAENRSMYLPLRVEVSPWLRSNNLVLLHFHSPHRHIESIELPSDYRGRVHRNRFLRKPHEDFNSFHGAFPFFTPVGVFGPAFIEVVDRVELGDVLVYPEVLDGARAARVTVKISASGEGCVRLSLMSPEGAPVAETWTEVEDSSGSLSLVVAEPRLWWPRGYGEQPIYTLRAELHAAGKLRDVVEKGIGFRTIDLAGDFHLRLNGKPIKLWGCNFAPLEQFSHLWPGERVARLLDLAENAHLVTLRLWGPGLPYGDNLYAEADRRGILLWSEFAHTWGMYPETAEFLELCRREAEDHVRRLQHHPSIFLWCGANEVHMGAEMMHPGCRVLSRQLYHEVYPSICGRLDPARPYHPDSPYGGAFANDPDHGDSHGYTHFWHVRGCDYAPLLTEHARWSPPQLKTLRRYVGDDIHLWPEGFVSRVRHRRPAPSSASGVAGNDAALDNRDIHRDGFLPPAWQLLGKGGHIVNGRAGPIGDFYDTGDSPEGLIYRLGSAHSAFLRRELERFRRGNPLHLAHQPRRTQGHYWWRFNGTWPLIDSELVDYLLEPKMAYYALRRAYAPLLLSFDIADRIHLWLTNDTGRAVTGLVRFELFGLDEPTPQQSLEVPVKLPHDASRAVLDLDGLGMVHRNSALSAKFVDPAGKEFAHTIDFADVERNLLFPDPAIELSLASPEVLEVSTDRFARSVELRARDGKEEAFGWIFEDNYFDLLPGQTRQVRLLERGPGEQLSARSFFGSTESYQSLH